MKPAWFADALRKGQGRAARYVETAGLGMVVDEVLAACLANQIFDTQCESDRTDWLWGMFNDTPQLPLFRTAILSRLAEESDTDHLSLLCALAERLAAHGDKVAENALKQCIEKACSEDGPHVWMGSGEWLKLKGYQGLWELAQLYGKQLLLNPESRTCDLSYADEIPQIHWAQLHSQGVTDSAVQRYLEHLQSEREFFQAARATQKAPLSSVQREVAQRKWVRATYPLSRILAQASAKVSDSPRRYAQFGLYATPFEKKRVLQALWKTRDPDIQTRLLWVFSETPLPYLDTRFFMWAGDENLPLLRTAALYALSHHVDPRIRIVAEAGIKGRLQPGFLGLFRHHLQVSDPNRIAESLIRYPADNEIAAHRLGCDVLELVQHHAAADWRAALVWVHDQTPCSECRFKALVQLHKREQLDPELLRDAAYDAHREIRVWAAEQLSNVGQGSGKIHQT